MVSFTILVEQRPGERSFRYDRLAPGLITVQPQAVQTAERAARLEAREINSLLYNRTPNRYCDDTYSRYAGDLRTENQCADDARKYGGKSQRVDLK